MTYLDFLEEIASMHKQSETPEQLKQTVLEQGSQMQKSVKLDLPKNCMVSPEHKAAREQLSQQMRDKLATMAINATSVPHVHLMRRGAFDRMINAVAVYYISKKQPEQVTRFQQLFAETESDTKRLEQLMKDGRKTKEQAQLALNEEKKIWHTSAGRCLGS